MFCRHLSRRVRAYLFPYLLFVTAFLLQLVVPGAVFAQAGFNPLDFEDLDHFLLVAFLAEPPISQADRRFLDSFQPEDIERLIPDYDPDARLDNALAVLELIDPVAAGLLRDVAPIMVVPAILAGAGSEAYYDPAMDSIVITQRLHDELGVLTLASVLLHELIHYLDQHDGTPWNPLERPEWEIRATTIELQFADRLLPILLHTFPEQAFNIFRWYGIHQTINNYYLEIYRQSLVISLLDNIREAVLSIGDDDRNFALFGNDVLENVIEAARKRAAEELRQSPPVVEIPDFPLEKPANEGEQQNDTGH